MAARPAVFVTRCREAFPALWCDQLEESCDVTYWTEDTPVPRPVLLEGVKARQGLLCLLTDRVDSEVVQEAESLKVVATMSVGYDHLDIGALKERGIKVGYTPGVLTAATADLTVSLLLATSRRLVEGAAALRAGAWAAWSPLWMCGPELAGSTVGIVGLGQIGQAVMQRLRPFGVARFLYCGRTRKEPAWEEGAQFVTFEELLPAADFVLVTCSYSPDLHHMFSVRQFGLMKRSAILVNTSRGGVVDQEALAAALGAGELLAAGLDVMTPEPLPTDHPLVQLPNCVLTPHLGSATLQTRGRMMEITVGNLLAGLQDQAMPAQLEL